MQNNSEKILKTSTITNIEIPNHPKNFPWDHLIKTIQSIITLIKTGQSPDEAYCKCSRFNLVELVKMAMEGHLIAGFSSNNENLASAITLMIWNDVCTLWNQQQQTNNQIHNAICMHHHS